MQLRTHQKRNLAATLAIWLLYLVTTAPRAGALETGKPAPPRPPGAPAEPATAAAAADIRRDATVQAVEKAMPSVVNIAVEILTERTDPYYQMLREYYRNWPREVRQSLSVGSGVIIDEAGYLITNYHVTENAHRIQVKLATGELYDAAQIVGTTQRDIVLLKIQGAGERKFKAMKFAPNHDLLLGETVIAIGNPYGLGGSVTKGILSSKNRREPTGPERLDVQDWLQTDADINPGNSGGPLINLRGELIGINVAVHREDQGMGVGFAIPVKQVNAALADFFNPEVLSALWFGGRVDTFQWPLTLSYIQPRSPAERAGLRVGQRLLAVNQQAPRNLAELEQQLSAPQTGDHRATLQLEDHGERRTVTVALLPFAELTRQKLGVVFAEIPSPTTQALGVRPGEAILIQTVEPGSPADRIQLRAGYLVTALDGRKTGSVLNAADHLSSKQAGETLQVSFYVPPRQGTRYGNYEATVKLR